MGRRKNYYFLLLSFLFVFVLALSSLASEVDAAKTYNIQYGKTVDGKFVNSYSKWNTKAVSGSSIKTPKVNDQNGKRAYWKTIINNKAYELKNGSTYKVSQATKFSLVWKDLHYVWYYNTSGTKEYTSQRLSLVMKDNFKLYDAKDTTSHEFLGWSRYKNATSPMYTLGKTYTMARDIKLYAVYKKKAKGTVRLYSQGGAKEYKEMNVTKYGGEKIYLPTLSDTDLYQFLGWSTAKCSLTPMYSSSEKYTVSGNAKLYAVFVKKPEPKVSLCYADGSAYKTVTPDGKSVRFPSVAFSDKRTCQGWSTKKGQKANPTYKENDVIPKKNATYYMVEDSFDSLMKPSKTTKESSKYPYVYMVGDSRIFLTEHFIGKTLSKTRLIHKSGHGYNWLTQSGGGYSQLLTKIKADNKKTSKRKAVIFCLGVNDLANADKYVSYYKSKAAELKKLGCDLYVMSVNPININQISYCYKTYKKNNNYKESRSQALLTSFNNKLKKNLAGTYEYIDTYSYLMKTGWPTYNLYYDIPDGLHYAPAVYQRIINYVSTIIDK